MKKALLILIFIAFCLSAWAQHLQEDIIPNSQQQKIELHKQQIKQQHDSLHEVHSKMSNGFQVNNNVQLKSTLNASKRLDSIVSPDSKTIVHFDDAGRLLEHIKHNSDANDTKRVSEYDNNGNRTSYSNYIWDDTLQDWVGETRTEDDYHSNGDLSSHRYYVWSTDTEDWDLRYQKDYDENGNTTLDISVNSLGGGYKRETTYDNNSQTILYTTYELENGQWIPQTEVSYDYDANGQISLRRNYVWENSQWALQTESTYEYTSSDSLTTEIIHTWDNTGTFLESTLIERTYNPDSQITSSYTYKSSTYPTPQWEEYEWQEYTYTADGLLASKTWYEYWIYGKQEYTYNSSNNIATSFSYYKLYLNNGWILDTSKHYEYDSEGRTILSTTNWYDFGDIIWIDRHRSSYDASGNRTLHSYETKNYYWRTEWKYEYTYDQYDNITQYIYSDEDGLDHKYDYTFDYTLEPSQIIHLDDGYMRLDYTKSYYSFGDWYVDHQGIYYYSDLPSNCPTGSITFSTQQEIDDFATNYPGCTQILGNLTIDGNTDTEITFLAGLSQVISIEGDLTINDNDALASLAGLDNLTSVGGRLYLGYNDGLIDLSGLDNLTYVGGSDLFLLRNDALTNLNGLEGMTSIEGDLYIGGNGEINSLLGLQNLTSIGGYLFVQGSELTDLSGLDNLTALGDYLRIQANYDLVSLEGLNNLTSIGGYLHFEGNSLLNNSSALSGLTSVGNYFAIKNFGLNDLSGFNNLTSVGTYLELRNTQLSDVSGFNNLTAIGNNLRLIKNDNLADISGLQNIDYTTISNLRITNNPDLAVCDIPNICEYLANSGAATISGNDPGCNTQAEIEAACMSVPACPVGDITFTNQQQIDDFPINYPECTTITGNLTIAGGSDDIYFIYDLDGLSQITEIQGNLTIGENFTDIDLSGLENVTSIGGELTIANNYELSVCNLNFICDYLENNGTATINNNASGCNSQAEVEASCTSTVNCPPGGVSIYDQQDVDDFVANYPECTAIEGDLWILGPNQIDLSGLNQITTINGKLDVQLSYITDFSGLENLETIGGDFIVEQNDDLASFQGLESLTTIGGNFNVFVNFGLNTFSGLESLNSIGGDFNIEVYSDSLNTLSGFDNLNSVGGSVSINSNYGLETLEGLNNLMTIGGDFDLSFNDNLTDISALTNLTSVGGDLSLESNVSLLDLGGLIGLTAIGGQLYIFDNIKLTDLNGLENLDYSTITDLTIEYNYELQLCNVSTVCDYLAAGGIADIADNAVGCNTQAQIESSCDSDMPCTAQVSNSVTEVFDEDLFIDGVGFANNPSITFSTPDMPVNATLSDVSLELYFRLNGSSCENEIKLQITDPAGNGYLLSTYPGCNGGNNLLYLNLDIPTLTTGNAADWLIQFNDTNDQNSDYEYSVRFARLKYTTTTVGSTTVVNEVSEYADMDLFIDGVGFENNGTYTFPDPSTPANAVLSDISLELYFRLNGNSCENEIALQITDPAGNSQALTAYTTCGGGNGLFYVNLDVPNGSTTGSPANWVVQFDDTNDQNTDYEYSVRFGRLTYTSTYTQGGSGGIPVTINEEVSSYADADLFIDGVGFANNGNYTFTDPGTPADAVLSDISLELYFRLNGNSCENEIALQITDPAGNTQPLTAYTTCDGGNGLFYVNLDVPSGSTTGSVAHWVLEFDDTNDQNSDYEYSVRFGRLTYDTEYTECVPMLVNEKDESEQLNNPTTPQLAKNNNSSTRQLINSSLKLYPVPASHLLNVEYFSENVNSTNIEILSNEGKMLMQKEEFLQEGINTIQLDIADLPAGHYHIRMYNASDMQMQSFVKIAP